MSLFAEKLEVASHSDSRLFSLLIVGNEWILEICMRRIYCQHMPESVGDSPGVRKAKITCFAKDACLLICRPWRCTCGRARCCRIGGKLSSRKSAGRIVMKV